MSCGYHRAHNDSLTRDVDKLRFTVFPEFRKGKRLSVTVAVLFERGALQLSPEKWEVRTTPEDRTVTAVVERSESQPPDISHPYHTEWRHLEYAVSSDEPNDVTFVLPPGTVIFDGNPVDVAPFRFSKVTKWDIFYGSINC